MQKLHLKRLNGHSSARTAHTDLLRARAPEKPLSTVQGTAGNSWNSFGKFNWFEIKADMPQSTPIKHERSFKPALSQRILHLNSAMNP